LFLLHPYLGILRKMDVLSPKSMNYLRFVML